MSVAPEGSPILSYDSIQQAIITGDVKNSVFTELMDTVGDGSGDVEMAAAADKYLIKPASGYCYLVKRLKLLVEDSGEFSVSVKLSFASLAALANGLRLYVEREELAGPPVVSHIVKTIFTDICTTEDLIMLGKHQFDFHDSVSNNPQLLTLNIELDEPIRIPYKYALVLETRDDMAALDSMMCRVEGITTTMLDS